MEAESTARTSKDLLYHYTSLDAFIRIVENNQLWASDLNVVNDPAELTHVRERLFELCTNASQGLSPLSLGNPGVSRFASSVLSYLQRTTHPHWNIGTSAFAVSFCQKRDLLSQWRGYGLQGNGICIGFSADALKTCFADATLVQVSYRTSELDEFLEDLFTEAFHLGGAPASERQIIAANLYHLVEGLIRNSHRFKLPAFRDEAETRLVSIKHRSLPRLDREVPWEIKVRVKGDRLVPYVILKPKEGRLPVREVMTGPAFKSASSVYALEGLLDSFGHPNVVKPSRFTLR
jgi:Protein of unknown function (DUF2971)